MVIQSSSIARILLAVLALVGLAGQTSTDARAADPPLVAAASDLQFAFAEIAEAYSTETGGKVRITYGSSGNFARQIRSGALIELFLSADERLVEGLANDELTDGDGVLYALGRLALIVPHGSPLAADGSLADLATALSDGRLKKLAIANPAHAPYGERAKEVLQAKGLWDALQGKLVLGENVAQAAQFATSGAADGGLVAYSLALSPAIGELAKAALVPAEWHRPLRQRMVLTRSAGPEARKLYDFLQGPAARGVLERHGFTLP